METNEIRRLEERCDTWNDTMRGVQRALVLALLREVGVFARLSHAGPCTAETLADELTLPARRFQAWLDCALDLGFLRKEKKLYSIVPGDEPLFCDDSDWHFRLHFVPAEKLFSQAADALHLLRADRWQAVAGSGESTDNQERERFLIYLDRRSRKVAREVMDILAETGPAETLLDLGGGAGTYAIALLQDNPRARAGLVERESARRVATESAVTAGVAARLHFHAIDLLHDPLPTDFDLVLCSNLLHIYGENDCRKIIARGAASLRSGGRLVVKDLRMDEDGRGPADALWFRLNMARVTEAGSVYPAGQIKKWMREAGLVPGPVFALHEAAESMLLWGKKP